MTNSRGFLSTLLLSLTAGCTTNVDLGEITETKTTSNDPDESADDDASMGALTSTGVVDPSSTGGTDTTATESTGGPSDTSVGETAGETAGTDPSTSTSTTDPSGGESTTSMSGGESTTNMSGGESTTSQSSGESTTSMSGGESTSDPSGGESTSSGDGTTGGDGLEGWTKYREILIDNGLVVGLDDFQIPVTVEYDSDMQFDFSDLRFTDDSGQVSLPYWIESSSAPVQAEVWIRVPTIAPDDITTVRMYYGNPNAQDASSGDDTFLFFDGFDGGALDAAVWATTAPVALEFGELRITKGAVYGKAPIGMFPNTTLEARITWHNEGGNLSSSLMASQGQTPGPMIKYMGRLHHGAQIFDGMKFVVQENLDANNEVPRIVGIATDADYSYFTLGHLYKERTYDGSFPLTFFPLLGHVWGKGAGMTEALDMDVDWVILRRFVAIMPETFIGGEKPA